MHYTLRRVCLFSFGIEPSHLPPSPFFVPAGPETQLTDDVVERGVVGARQEVGEEVDHHEAVLLALKLFNHS